MAISLLTPALTVFEQMALDEVLAREINQEPVLRFYHWTQGPAVTFGCSQFYHAVQEQISVENGPACRRPTGGGIVYHGADLTFSLVFESSLRPTEIYARLHGAIEQALLQAQVQSMRQGAVSPAAYAPATNGIANGCFANPVKDDLLAGGRKILGGAIRRYGTGILYQGSLQCENARSNPTFRRAVMQAAQQMLGMQFVTRPVWPELLNRARQLAADQYGKAAWTERFL